MFVITGGGSGIGRELALALSDRGKPVLIVGRRLELLEKTAQRSSLISFLQADVGERAGREKIISYLQNHGQLEGLVHNAGIIEPIVPIQEIDEEAWQKFLAVNVNAPLFLTQALLPKLKQGRVLHIGSGAAYFPVVSWSGYCVSKAALAMLTRCWQSEEENVAVSSVMPGIIDTPMQVLIRDATCMAEEKHQFFVQLKHQKKLLDPKTVALFLSWLLLDVSRDEFRAQEWDIYEKKHHHEWLKAPHVVPHWD